MNLEVHQHLKEDVYHDRVRIPEVHRGNIREGRICKVRVNGRSSLFEVRGLVGEKRPVIRIGDRERGDLALDLLRSYDFEVSEVGWIGQFRWAWNASDSASRIAARLGLLGFVLGLVGVVLSVLPLFH